MPIGLLLPPASRHSRPTTALPLQSDKADVRVDLHDRSAQKVLMMALRSNDASSSMHSLPDRESNGVGGGDRRKGEGKAMGARWIRGGSPRVVLFPEEHQLEDTLRCSSR